MELGQQIRQARENKNLSQEELASRLGVSRQAVSKWENNSAIPQGLNREVLSQVLELELPAPEGVVKQRRWAIWLGWGLAAVLLCFSLGAGLRVHSLQRDSQPAPGASLSETDPSWHPAVERVQFYDRDKNFVNDVALWYNAAEIDCILIQWADGTPDSIQVFYTPGGTETMEQTELLLTKSVPDGDTVALLSADALERISMGHVYFVLNFGQTAVTSDVYNMFFDAEA